MPNLDFKITGVEPGIRGVTRLLLFRLEISSRPAPDPIHSIYAHKRNHGLLTWEQTLRPLLPAADPEEVLT